jgi:N-acetylmuramic acid 6-phosphate etherase
MSEKPQAELGKLRTEQVDEKFHLLDIMSVKELLTAMNESDADVPKAIALQLPAIERAIDVIVDRLMQGGRLVYIGAGTSGRLGVLDAAECGPTFSILDDQVIALIAGGERAIQHAVEGAEDRPDFGVADLKSINLRASDAVVGIAASGRTPYVIGAIDYARSIGAATISLTSNPQSELSSHVEFPIEIDSGPEVLAGSTRLKSGTSQKLVLNMISTISMIRLGKTFGNLMVDLQVTNGKLRDRAIRIIESATGAPRAQAEKALEQSGFKVKIAILMILLNLDAATAKSRLESSSDRIREALSE